MGNVKYDVRFSKLRLLGLTVTVNRKKWPYIRQKAMVTDVWYSLRGVDVVFLESTGYPPVGYSWDDLLG